MILPLCFYLNYRIFHFQLFFFSKSQFLIHVFKFLFLVLKCLPCFTDLFLLILFEIMGHFNTRLLNSLSSISVISAYLDFVIE
jgi:hypothetical protein